MVSILAVQQTSGGEVQRLIEGLALEAEPVALDGGWRFDFEDGSLDPDDAIEDMRVSLNRLSDTWPIPFEAWAGSEFPGVVLPCRLSVEWPGSRPRLQMPGGGYGAAQTTCTVSGADEMLDELTVLL